VPEPTPTVNPNSTKVLANKFLSDLEPLLADAGDKLTYFQLVDIMKSLKFLQAETSISADRPSENSYLILELWDMLSRNESKIPSSGVRAVLLAIMDFWIPKKMTELKDCGL
jgi:hypothetical protein